MFNFVVNKHQPFDDVNNSKCVIWYLKCIIFYHIQTIVFVLLKVEYSCLCKID